MDISAQMAALSVGQSFIAFCHHVANTTRADTVSASADSVPVFLRGEKPVQIASALWTSALATRSSTFADSTTPVPDPRIEAQAAKERELWRNFRNAPLLTQLDRLGTLRNLYLRHFLTRGGVSAYGWLDEIRSIILQDIYDRNRFCELVTMKESGWPIIHFETDMVLPPFLTFPPNVDKPPVIYSPAAAKGSLGYWAYFRIDDITMTQDVVCVDCVKRFKDIAERDTPLPDPIIVSLDRQAHRFFIDDGYHRTFAAHELGADYILGKVTYAHSWTGATYSLSSIRRIDHKEHLERIALVREQECNSDPFKQPS